MDNNKKIMIKNLSNGRVGINLPDLRLKRIWERKNAEKPIEFGVLQQAIYDPGVEYMFTQGILGIDDMEAKIALGLEPEDAKEPVNIIILTDAQKKRLWTVAPTFEFKNTLRELPYEQIEELADYAIENEYINMEKCALIKDCIQRDILAAIQLNRKDKEE